MSFVLQDLGDQLGQVETTTADQLLGRYHDVADESTADHTSDSSTRSRLKNNQRLKTHPDLWSLTTKFGAFDCRARFDGEIGVEI